MDDKKIMQGERISDNITLCKDGKYRWIYELHLFKTPIIFMLVWKILFFIFLMIFAFVFIADFVSWGFTAERIKESLRFSGFFLLGMTVVTALGYSVYAALMGGKYCVMFEMDEKGINHKQIPAQAKKAKKIAGATALAGAASGRLTTVGAGINSARTEIYSDFSRVRKVKAFPALNLIKVNGRLSRNQIYASKEDFEFVKKYIKERCMNIQKQG